MLTFVVTSDGSRTLYHAGVGEHYHSHHGAVQESRHVFVGMGLAYFAMQQQPTRISILEVGFGTGLNFLLSADYCSKNDLQLDYTGIEAYPVPADMLSQTGYEAYVPPALWSAFQSRYLASLSEPQAITAECTFEIAHCPALHFHTEKQYDILYFDAFAAIHQPEMWTEETLRHVCAFLKPGGIFVTYAITGHLKRTLKALGFSITKVPGAPGKREMLRALKEF